MSQVKYKLNLPVRLTTASERESVRVGKDSVLATNHGTDDERTNCSAPLIKSKTRLGA